MNTGENQGSLFHHHTVEAVKAHIRTLGVDNKEMHRLFNYWYKSRELANNANITQNNKQTLYYDRNMLI